MSTRSGFQQAVDEADARRTTAAIGRALAESRKRAFDSLRSCVGQAGIEGVELSECLRMRVKIPDVDDTDVWVVIEFRTSKYDTFEEGGVSAAVCKPGHECVDFFMCGDLDGYVSVFFPTCVLSDNPALGTVYCEKEEHAIEVAHVIKALVVAVRGAHDQRPLKLVETRK